jgi:seryl-tRNA synthetase
MLDIKWIRENPALFDAAMGRRGLGMLEGVAASEFLLGLDGVRREAITKAETAKSEMNKISKQIGEAFQQKKPDEAAALKQKAEALKAELASLSQLPDKAEAELNDWLARLPNLLDDSVPSGSDEQANQEVRRWGTAPALSGEAKEHDALGEGLGMMDFETAGKVSGARFVYLTHHLARLERALASFMLDMHTQEFAYTEVVPPYLVRGHSLFGTGQLPKFAEDCFRTTGDHWLIPTAEVSLTNMVQDRILAEDELPLRLTAWTPCFRSEAGSAGRDTRGMIRQHQFSKVELVSVTSAQTSAEEHERMVHIAETVLQKLGLHYRVMLLCSGDTGFGSRKTYDLEVWLPGQKAFREISSVSNCGDFQARRMKARYRPAGSEKGTEFVHTLNGSALAVGRTLVAVLENYQQADGSIALPEALLPYMGGVTRLAAA